jgi:hypothetical protein
LTWPDTASEGVLSPLLQKYRYLFHHIPIPW